MLRMAFPVDLSRCEEINFVLLRMFIPGYFLGLSSTPFEPQKCKTTLVYLTNKQGKTACASGLSARPFCMDRSLFSAAEPPDDRSVFDLSSDAEFDGSVVYVPGGDDVQNGVTDRFQNRPNREKTDQTQT